MSITIGLISDTHSYIGRDTIEHIKECDEIWHAGDIGHLDTADAIEAIGPSVRMVWGNIDDRSLRNVYPKDLVWTSEGLKVYMTHIGGYPGKYHRKALQIIDSERPGLFICGHSHILKVQRDVQRDLLHMNPGACGQFQITDGTIHDLNAIELGPRGSLQRL